MIDMEMSYRASSLKFHRHLTWNHVWDCLVITDLRPIFSHLSSPLLSSPLSRSLELTPCGEGWWIPGFPKHICWGSFFWGPITSHTHIYKHYELRCCAPPFGPPSRLKKSCITTSNFWSEIGCLCVLSHPMVFFQGFDTPLLSHIFYLLSVAFFF